MARDSSSAPPRTQISPPSSHTSAPAASLSRFSELTSARSMHTAQRLVINRSDLLPKSLDLPLQVLALLLALHPLATAGQQPQLVPQKHAFGRRQSVLAKPFPDPRAVRATAARHPARPRRGCGCAIARAAASLLSTKSCTISANTSCCSSVSQMYRSTHMSVALASKRPLNTALAAIRRCNFTARRSDNGIPA